MKLRWNLRTGFERYLTSWRSADDPSPGDSTYRLDITELPQLILRTGSKKVARSGPWNGYRFGGIPLIQNSIFIPRLVDNQDELYFTYNPFNTTVITRLVLDRSGTIHHYVWNEGRNEWCVMYSWPFNLCDNYEECGVNGNCRISKTPICGCLKGYVPKSQDEWNTPQTTECIKKLPSDCPRGEGFLKLPRMKLPDIDWYNESMNLKECKTACTKNCSCRAYANSNLTRGGTGCLMWFKDLTDMEECSKQYTWGQDIFLRVPASELAKLPLEASSTSSPGFIHHREMFD
ncbi:G-type lectin S-receptor-like serine/threonine-protein kinase At4g27290 [Pistacia vera]|uniref:G-type lectin S-receptor-like serine/threonine-protein kinase At4g27290 n=1 Tax=Pistacia vera TaxID=55513 RepID=UPI0012633E06|nr:G-type lectin S-receptor-like serine/threonine-protein kinase At4g27290 [Pistacia vera]